MVNGAVSCRMVVAMAALPWLPGFVPAAQGRDLAVYGGVAIEHYTESADRQARTDLIGYLKLDYGGAYAGVWTELSDRERFTEVTFSLGYYASAGRISYDVHYYHYVYPQTGTGEYGKLGLVLGYALTDELRLGTELYSYPDKAGTGAYLTADVAVGEKLGFDLLWGEYDMGYGGYAEWEVGGYYRLTDRVTFGLRYYEGEQYDDYVRLQLAWGTTLFRR